MVRPSTSTYSPTRKQASLNKGQVLAMIDFVKRNKPLWSKGDAKFKNTNLKDRLWSNFVEENDLSCGIKSVKQRWANLRSNFVKK